MPSVLRVASGKNPNMALAREAAMRSTCAKVQVGAVVARSGWLLGWGNNTAIGEPASCPRVEAGFASGEGYHLCVKRCHQQGHAEVQALRAARSGWGSLEGADAYVWGHERVCEPCLTLMAIERIARVFLSSS